MIVADTPAQMSRLSERHLGPAVEWEPDREGETLLISEGEIFAVVGGRGTDRDHWVASLALTVRRAAASAEPQARGGLGSRSPDGPVALVPWMTILENVLLGVREAHQDWSNGECRNLAGVYLACVGLADLFHKRPAELSPSLRQRVGMARAFALDATLVVLEEPCRARTLADRIVLEQGLLRLRACDRKAIVLATSELTVALGVADRILLLSASGDETPARLFVVQPSRTLHEVAEPRDFIDVKPPI